MRTQQQSSWFYIFAALLAGVGLALGATACEPNEGVYEGTDDEAAVFDEQQEEGFGTFDGQREEQVVGTEPIDQEEIEEVPGQPLDEGEQQAELGQQEDISLEDMDPSQISDQDLAQFARLRLKLEQARQGGLEGEVGGGPIEGQDMEEWETEMIQREGMDVDRYLAIRMMLQDSPELQQRYEQVLGEIHEVQ